MKSLMILVTLFCGLSLVMLPTAFAWTDYALNTAPPSNYGTLVQPPFTTAGLAGQPENPPQDKVRLTNGDRIYSWTNVDGWDGDTSIPYRYFIIDLGSVKTDIKSVVLWAIPNAPSAITDISTGTVYGSNDTTIGYTSWGTLTTIDSRTTVVGLDTAKAWFWETPSNHSARFIKVDLTPINLGAWFAFSEVEVWNAPFTYSPVSVPKRIWELYQDEP